ncbi:MAG: efflux RND transporter periplasmic adaptor subunit, partial [Polyangiaceae bacterium]
IAAPPGGDLPIASQVAGRIVDILVHEGDRVISGAIVANIDGSASQDALSQADAALLQAKAAGTNADATLDRTKQLVGRGIAAKQELDDANARADQAHAGVKAATAAADLARRTLGRVQVRSTFGGVVTRVWRGPGALVDGTAATPIVQLAASSLAEFNADATATELAGIAPGQKATIALAVNDTHFEGTVRTRSTALDPATDLGSVRIAVTMPSPVTLGLFGTAVVALGKRDNVLVIPSAALRGAVADGAELVVCKDGKADDRSVKIGWRDDQRVEVVDGLADGDRVAIDHVLGLETGTAIVEAK